MSLPDILFCHRLVRDALWLWEYLLANTVPSDEPWMAVATGFWITDEQLAYRLDVTAPTIKRWRLRLERLGYLRFELVRPRHRLMWLANLQAPSQSQTLLEAPVAAGLVN
jgi:hypothetical protein